jgi:hypothetical protein
MKYAVIQDGIVTNLAESEPEFAASQGWVSAPDYVNNEAVNIGWAYDGVTFTPPQEIQPEQS